MCDGEFHSSEIFLSKQYCFTHFASHIITALRVQGIRSQMCVDSFYSLLCFFFPVGDLCWRNERDPRLAFESNFQTGEHRMSISECVLSDSGQYKCKAQSPHCATSCSAQVNVLSKYKGGITWGSTRRMYIGGIAWGVRLH